MRFCRAGGGSSLTGATLASGFKEDDSAGGGDVERSHLTGHRNAEQVVAGMADQLVQTSAFASEDDYGIGREVAAVVILGAALVEANDPEVVGLEGFEGADKVDHAREAEMLGGSGGGLNGGGGKGGGAALGEEDAIDAGGFGGTQQRAEILWILNAVEGEEKAGILTVEEVFDVEEVAFPDDGDDALVGRGSGETGEGIARLGTGPDAGGAAEGGDSGKAGVMSGAEALLSEANVIEAA